MSARAEYLIKLTGEYAATPSLYAVAAILAVTVFVGALVVVLSRHKSQYEELARMPLDP